MKKKYFSLLAAILSMVFAIPSSTVGEVQQTSNVMIVFDASGSMWGQIDGVTKIEIARDAFANAQSVWDGQDNNVGLMAYGHRRKGDCGDIETLVPIGNNTGAQIADSVQALQPKGKTPLSDALAMAASELRFREETATVILFSDGIESCSSDPCALARQLEQDGINFTAHVIGFGLGDTADRRQLQCIADNTGGTFVEAQDASGLQDALTRVAASPEPAPMQEEVGAVVSFRVTITEEEGTVRPDEVAIRATNSETGERQVLGRLQGAEQVISGLQAELPVGDWTLEAISNEGGGEVRAAIAVDTQQVEIPFKANATDFVLIADGPFRLGVEHAVFLGVTDPLQANAEFTLALYPAGATDNNQRIDWETRFGSDNAGFTEHGFAPPDAPGAYEILVMRGNDPNTAIARFPIVYAEGASISWQGKRRGEPGEELAIRISGDTYRNNTLALRAADGTDVTREWLQTYMTSENGPVLALPDREGIYELFYKATTEVEEISLGKITVGNVVLEDDPDAVAPPDEVAEPLASEAEVNQATGDDGVVVFRCEQPVCLYNSAALRIGGIPVMGGFGIANETRDDEGRASFDVINLTTNNVITLNPVFMANTMDCFTVSENGRNEGLEQAQLCLSANSDGATVSQYETLEYWVAEQNAKALEAELAKDRAAHDATMGEDTIFTTSSLNGGWSLRNTETSDIVAIVAIDTAGEGTITLDILVYGNAGTGLDGAQQYSVPAMPLTDQSTELLGISALSNDVIIQLSRPPNWDGAENIFSGLLTIQKTGKTLRVEMF